MLEATNVFKCFGGTSMLCTCLWERSVALKASETCWKGAPFPSVALSVLLVLDDVCTACVLCGGSTSSMIANHSFRDVMLLLLGRHLLCTVASQLCKAFE